MEIEELEEALLNEQEKNKALASELETLKADSDKLKADNERLLDYNNKLFMRVGTPAEDKPADESEEEVTEETLINNIKKIMEENR